MHHRRFGYVATNQSILLQTALAPCTHALWNECHCGLPSRSTRPIGAVSDCCAPVLADLPSAATARRDLRPPWPPARAVAVVAAPGQAGRRRHASLL
eukprot:6179909-Pleurochrysis_carterae.AAC.1